ncbi:MAG TPA: TaqI-like C-terminal specificity domain-containing protein [Candidatus Lokiarchaeia archaeon]|nr:TaqI-like C-terminal specificity domain-containing protein [Candidatus Lokiarchaeia archaeon]
MRQSNDEIHELYNRLEYIRANVIEHPDRDVNDDILDQAEYQLFQDIMIVYFLCDAGLVKIDGKTISGSELFSDDCLNDGNLVDNFIAVVECIEGSGTDHVEFNGHDVRCNRLNIALLNSWHNAESVPNLFKIDQENGHAIFEALNEFQWCIDEFSPDDLESYKIITPAILADFFALKEPGDSRKKKGIYYTPRDIARYICKEILQSFLLGKQASDFSDPLDAITREDTEILKKALNNCDTLKVLDPACGTGEFLVIMANELMLTKKKLLALLDLDITIACNELRNDILLRTIHGTDLMDTAVLIVKQRLWLWALASLKGVTINDNDVITCFELSPNIQAGNALIGWLDENIEEPGTVQATNDRLSEILYREHGIAAFADLALLQQMRPIHWRLVYPGGFDIIIGNPPYVFTRGSSFSDLETACYKTWYLPDYSTSVRGKARQAGKMNMYGLFIVRAMSLLKDHGMLGFIVPNTILRTTTNDTLRQFILDKAFIKEIVDLEGGVFTDVTASTIIMMLEKKLTNEASNMLLVKHAIVDLLGGKFQHHPIDQARFLENPAFCFDIHVTDDFAAISRSIKEDSFELGEITSEIIEGLVTRRGDGLFTTDATNPMARKMLRGKDIDRYAIHWRSGQYIIYDPVKLHRARPVHVHEAPVKLLAQRIGGGAYPLRVAYDDQQFYVFASINALILKDSPSVDQVPYSYKYILACLNSTLLNAYYLLNFSNKSTLTVNVSKTFLEMLPIKKASPQIQDVVAAIVDYILFLKSHHDVEKDLVKFFDKVILDGLIFEHYLILNQDTRLVNAVANLAARINPDGENDDETLASIRNTMASLLIDAHFKKIEQFIQNQPAWLYMQELFKKRVRGQGN